MKQTIFYDTDTQHDFMDEDGKLYVPGAEDIKKNLETLTKFAVEKGYRVMGSVDAHTKDDPEFKTFPEHCVAGTKGQTKIDETTIDDTLYVPNREHTTKEIKDLVDSKKTLIFEKQHYDIFTSPVAEKVLEQEVKEAVLYGVATDICDKAAAIGMRRRDIKVYIVTDAVAGVFPDKTVEAFEDMYAAGVKPITTAQVLEKYK